MSAWAVVIILWVVIAAAFAVVWLVRRSHGPLDTGASTAFIGSAVGLLLSLVLFFAMGHYRDAQVAAQAEATSYTTLFSSMAPLPGAISDPPQHAVVCVMRATADEEWPAMAGGDFDGSPGTRKAIAGLYSAVEAIPRGNPAVAPYYGTIWNGVLERAGARDARLAEGATAISPAIWVVIYVGVFVVLVLVGLEERLTGRRTWIGVGAALAVALTALVGVSAILDQPYSDPGAVGPDAIRNSLAVVESSASPGSPVTAPCRA